MITIQEAQEVVKSVKFLDWKFEVEDTHSGIRLILIDRVKDSFSDSLIPIPIITEFHMSLPPSKEIFVYILWDFVINRLRHEAGELFYVNGELPYNEHDNRTAQEIIKSIYPKEAFT